MLVSETPKPLRQVRRDAARALDGASETPELDAELLLRHLLDFDRMQLVLHANEPVPPQQLAAFERLVERRRAGEPVAYILGKRGFRTIELAVDRRVMVPRPETEQIVDIALSRLAQHSGPARIIDVGTGSGAIALSLAMELGPGRSDVEIVASDVSSEALDVARRNRDALGLQDRVTLCQADLLTGLGGEFDVILANLPYLRPDQQHPSTAYEPRLALFAGDDGFDSYRKLFEQAKQLLASGGMIVVEIDPSQAEFGSLLARERTGLQVEVRQDIASRPRFLVLSDSYE